MSITPPPPPPPSAVGGFCGRCGTRFEPGTAFCGSCRFVLIAPPPAATGYTYPVMAAAAVPATHHKLSATKLAVVMVVVTAIVVASLTTIAVLRQPTAHPCGFYCGPKAGSPLLGPAVYTNSTYGFTVEYEKDLATIAHESGDGVDLQWKDGDGELIINASNGTPLDQAMNDAVSKFPTSTYQDIKQVGPVQGAELGTVQGQGVGYAANLIPSSGGKAVPVAIVIIAAQKDGTTIVESMVSSRDTTSQQLAPFGVVRAGSFDYVVLGTHFKGT